MLVVILAEIRAVPAERSRGRHNPRAVKRKMSNFPTRSRAAPADKSRFRYADHIQIMAPAVPEPPMPAREVPTPEPVASLPAPGQQAKRTAPNANYRRHVKAWRASGRSRSDYCRDHDLDETTLHHWVARLRNTFRRKDRGVRAAS
jgi:hypothetical protein